MSDRLGSSFEGSRHSSLLRHVPHPIKMLRRTQSHSRGLGYGLGFSSLHLGGAHHWTGDSTSIAGPFSLAGTFLRRWESSREEVDHYLHHHHGHGHHRRHLFSSHHHLHHQHQQQQQNQLHQSPGDASHHHSHHHQHHHRGGFSLFRRWGSTRERSSRDEHSLASVELASWTARSNARRGSSLPLPFCAGLSPVEAARKAETLEGNDVTFALTSPSEMHRHSDWLDWLIRKVDGHNVCRHMPLPAHLLHMVDAWKQVQAAIIKLFQRKPLKENELGTLQESVRALSEAEAGSLIYEYYKDQLLKKGMVILREKIKNEQGSELMEMLGETWDYFFKEILPSLQALMYPLAEASKDIDIRNTTLLEFRNIVVLKVGLKEAIDTKKYHVPVNIQQMLLILQGLHDPTFLSKEQLDLEKLVACVVVPFLGSRGMYEGGPEPVTKANYRPTVPHVPFTKPRITITVSDASAEDSSTQSPRLLKVDQHHHHPIISPASMRKLGMHEPSSSQGVLVSHRLKPVMEVLDVGRRHSIVGT